jgi:hypothetical protein
MSGRQLQAGSAVDRNAPIGQACRLPLFPRRPTRPPVEKRKLGITCHELRTFSSCIHQGAEAACQRLLPWIRALPQRLKLTGRSHRQRGPSTHRDRTVGRNASTLAPDE